MRGSHSIAPKTTTKSIFILIPPERKPKTMNQEQSPIANREVSGDRERQRKNARDNLIHAGEFTKIENTAIAYVLRGWFGALIRPENTTEIAPACAAVPAPQTPCQPLDRELTS